jgi:hypothetical protein
MNAPGGFSPPLQNQGTKMSVTNTPYDLPGNIRLIVTSTPEDGDQQARLITPGSEVSLTMLELEKLVLQLADAQMNHTVLAAKPKRATKRKEVEA